MQLVKGNSRSTISTHGYHQTMILVLISHSLRINQKQMILHQILILIMKKHHKNNSEKKQFMDLGTETNLQSQRHNRGQTTLGLDYASLSPKQMACGFSYWDKMSILQITLWKLKFHEVTAKPTALHCLDCTLYQYCNYYMLLFMLTPLGFHNNILLRFNCARKKG